MVKTIKDGDVDCGLLVKVQRGRSGKTNTKQKIMRSDWTAVWIVVCLAVGACALTFSEDNDVTISFPPSTVLRECYHHNLQNDQYLAEKTWPTIDAWLSNKVKHPTALDLVTEYALHDYHAYLDKAGGLNAQLATLMAEWDRTAIKTALRKCARVGF
jgi:hypothetical protein